MLTAHIYIQFSERRLKLSSPQIADPFECTPFMALENRSGKKIVTAVGREAEGMRGKSDTVVINPFADPEVVIGDFAVATKLLTYAVQSFLGWRWRVLPPIGIIHSDRRQQAALTLVEQRTLIELCKAASFRKAAIHEGRPLTMDEIQNWEIRD